jgi:hypothetical protein
VLTDGVEYRNASPEAEILGGEHLTGAVRKCTISGCSCSNFIPTKHAYPVHAHH